MGKHLLGVDTETEGFFDHENKVIMLQIGDKDHQFVFDTRSYDISPLKQVLENKNIIKIFWNAKFDYKFIKYCFDIELENIYDGFLAECLITSGLENRILSLGGVVERDLGVKLDKETRNKFVGLNGRPFTERQIKYGAEDVGYLIDIYELQKSKIEKYNLDNCLLLENQFVKVLGDIEMTGLYLDKDKWLKLELENEQEYFNARQKLNNYVIKHGNQKFIDQQLDLFSTEPKCNILWSSSKQVIPFMKEIGVNTEILDRKTGEKKDSIEEKVLDKYKSNEFVKMYLDYKGLEKSINAYGKKFIKNVNKVTKRVHSNYWQILNTGRISSSDPNLQQVPRGPHRECFVADEGNVLVVCDYSGQEQRVLADRCKDPALLDFYTNGDGDMHCMVARKVFPEIEPLSTDDIKDHHDDKRQYAKIVGFAMNYGGSAFTIKDKLNISEEEAQAMVDAYFDGFPQMTQYFKEKTEESLKNGYILIDNVTNRKYFIPFYDRFKELESLVNREGFWEEYRANRNKYRKEVRDYFILKGKIERNSKNYPIQGLSGSMTKLAAILVKQRLKKAGIEDKAFIVNLVHDEIVMECKKEIAEQVSKLLSKAMEDAGDRFCKTVPMIASAVITNFWNH